MALTSQSGDPRMVVSPERRGRRCGDAQQDMTQAARAILYRGKRPLDTSHFAPEIVILAKGRDGERAVPNMAPLGEPDSFELVQDHQWFGSQVRRYGATHGDRSRQVSIAYTPEGLLHWMRSS